MYNISMNNQSAKISSISLGSHKACIPAIYTYKLTQIL